MPQKMRCSVFHFQIRLIFLFTSTHSNHTEILGDKMRNTHILIVGTYHMEACFYSLFFGVDSVTITKKMKISTHCFQFFVVIFYIAIKTHATDLAQNLANHFQYPPPENGVLVYAGETFGTNKCVYYLKWYSMSNMAMSNMAYLTLLNFTGISNILKIQRIFHVIYIHPCYTLRLEKEGILFLPI